MLARYLRQFIPLSILLAAAYCCLPRGFAQTGLQNGLPTMVTLTPGQPSSFTFSGTTGGNFRVSYAQTSGENLRGTISTPCSGGYSYGTASGSFSSGGSCTLTLTTLDSSTDPPAALTVAVSTSPAPTTGNNGGALDNGLPANGSVVPGHVDVWQFNALQADVPSVLLTQSGSSLVAAQLFNPAGGSSGVVSKHPDGSITYTGATFTGGGTWTLVVYTDPHDQQKPDAQNYTLTLSGSTAPPFPQKGKQLGYCAACLAAARSNGMAAVGDPINVSTGNAFETITDYTTAGVNPLSFIRYYNSLTDNQATAARPLGANWRSNYDRYLHILSSTIATAERADGRILTFSYDGSAWHSSSDVDYQLSGSGSSYTLTDSDDVVESYTVSGGIGYLQEIQWKNGYYQQLAGNTAGQPTGVSDAYGRALGFVYSGAELTGVTTQEQAVGSQALTYAYTPTAGQNLLTSVTYGTASPTAVTYQYGNSSFPFALTAILDQNVKQFSSWAYDSVGRATQSQHGDASDGALGANKTTVQYNADSSTTVTLPLGQQEIYKFAQLQGAPKIVSVDRSSAMDCSSDCETFGYDAAGYLNAATDWNGNQTSYTNNSYGLPTHISEGSGARVTDIQYTDSYWPRLPTFITTTGLTTANTYDHLHRWLTSKTLTDTGSTHYGPTSRLWQYAYSSTGQLATITDPRGNQTHFDYAGNSAPSYGGPADIIEGYQSTIARTTTISSTAGWRPQTVTDPNGVVTTLTYDGRERLLSSTVATSGGNHTTSFTYDSAGGSGDAADNVATMQLPDGGVYTYTYDTAHRLKQFTNPVGDSKQYGLDANGDRTLTQFVNNSQIKYKESAQFDALGRMSKHIGGQSQVVSYTYDANGNMLTFSEPWQKAKTTMTYDALNRVKTSYDFVGGETQYSYDDHDRPVSVTAPNGAATSYTYDGFGDLGLLSSPDTMATQFTFDAFGNVATKTDARSITATYAYDALNRRTSIHYPATSENVTYNYDEAGHSFGIGRLTSMIDQAGTLSRAYDERGSLLSETRGRTVSGSTVNLTTGYSYDAANRIAAITYPDGMKIMQGRDAAGRITGLRQQTVPHSSPYIISGVKYYPFSSTPTYIGFGIGGTNFSESRGLDLSYRTTGISVGNVLNLSYSYDPDDNATTITDNLNAANTQALGFDDAGRLRTASATNYGSHTYDFDTSGNSNGNRTAYDGAAWTYQPGSNRLATAGSLSLSYDANGNVMGLNTAPATMYVYNNANRLDHVTVGSGTTLSYLYDGFGQRITKTDSALRFLQYGQDGALLEVTDSTGSPQTDYIYLNGRPVATYVAATGVTSYLQTDKQNQPLRATDGSGNVGWTFNPDQFGYTMTPPVGTIANDLRYPGQEFEMATGFHHNGFRDYMPAWGRYLESDPIGLGGGINTYAYAGGNPGRFVDPRGLDDPREHAICGDVCIPDETSGLGGAGGGAGDGSGYSLSDSAEAQLEASQESTATQMQSDLDCELKSSDAGRNRAPNYQSDQTSEQMQQSLRDNGFTQETSSDGRAVVYRNGDTSYSFYGSESRGQGVLVRQGGNTIAKITANQ